MTTGASRPKVHIILLNWNNYKDTAACLNSLQGLRYDNGEVVIVDNASTDDSVSRLRSEFPRVKIVANPHNLGFSGGCNAGIRYAVGHSTDFVWLLNNDTIVDPDALQALVDLAQTDRRIGAVGSAISYMDAPQHLQSWGGGYVNFWLGRSRHFLAPVSDDRIEFITGASMLIPKEALENIGLLDEEFFMYWEDADYCFRLRKANWRLAVAGRSKLRHEQFGSVGKGSARLDSYFNASAVRFFRKHSPFPWISIWVGVATRLVKRVLTGDRERVAAILRGALS